MDRILRLDCHQLLIQFARLLQVSLLHAGVRQQLGDFADVGGLAGFLEQLEKKLEALRFGANVADNRVKIFEDLRLIQDHQAIPVLLIYVERVLEESAFHQGRYKPRNAFNIVVNRKQLGGQHSRVGQPIGRQIGLEQRLEGFRLRVNIGNLLEIADCAGAVSRFQRVLAAQQQDLVAFRIQRQHAL